VGTVGRAAGTVAQTATQAVQGAAQGQGGANETLQTLGVDEQALLAPVNQRLAQQGSPPVRAEQLENATRESLRMSLQQGRFDRETMITALSRETAMSREEADRAAAQIEMQFNQRFQQVQQGALEVAEDSGPVFLSAFAALLLGLIASILGAVLGVRQHERHATRIERERPTIIESGPVGTPAAT
jgi:hypothetical protein